jgi:hypothetical protein
VVFLDIAIGTIFFVLGLILALSKSAKGSMLMTFLLGLVGGGGGSVVVGGGHIAILEGGKPPEYLWNLAGFLFAVDAGVGLILGVAVKYFDPMRQGPIEISVVQEPVDPKDKIPLSSIARRGCFAIVDYAKGSSKGRSAA